MSGFFRSLLDAAVGYTNFAITFAHSPAEALRAHARKGEVAGDLMAYYCAGLSLAACLGLIFPPPLLAVLTSLKATKRVADLPGGQIVEPALVLGLGWILLVGLILHLAARGVESVERAMISPPPAGTPHVYLRGVLQDTLNAALGFGSVAIPAAMATLCLLSAAPTAESGWLPGLRVLAWFGFALAAFGYLVRSLAAVHRVPAHRATTAAAAGLVLGGLVVLVVSKL